MSIAALAQQTRERVTTHSSRVLLMIVPQATEGVQATHKYFAKFLTIVAVIGFLSLLGVRTLLAQDAFELTSLKLEAKLVSDEREAIARQIDKLSSPEALAKSATDLGMKPSENPTFLSLDKPLLEEEVIEAPVKNG
mgnify:CR=1 FL=1